MPLSRRWAVRSRRGNRWLAPLLLRLPGFALVHHVGRNSRRPYKTPLRLMPGSNDGTVYVALTYGLATDWFLNLQANPGSVENARRLRAITDATAVAVDRVTPRSTWQRFQLRAVSRAGIEHMAVLGLGEWYSPTV